MTSLREPIRALEEPVTRSFVLRSVAVWLAGHVLVWTIVAVVNDLDVAVMLDRWDSSWYSRIARDGYSWPAWAFYPLYPLLVRGLMSALPFAAGVPQVLGLALSTALFGGFCWRIAALAERRDDALGLCPRTRAGWLVFLFSPASFVFHSHHTESLFILLALVALELASRAQARGAWLGAAVASGLAALTRPQGIFLAVASAWASSAPLPGWRRRVVRFGLSGLASGALYACYPLYQWIVAGDPNLAQSSQLYWRPEVSALTFVRTLYFGNPWQNTTIGSIERHVGFVLLLAATALLWKRRRVLAVYVGLCIAVMPAQGELVGLFRYAAVLFPALFAGGDKLGRLPRGLVFVCAAALLFYNLALARRYVMFRWCY